MIKTTVEVSVALTDEDCFEVPDIVSGRRRLRVILVRYHGGLTAHVNCVQVYSHGGTTANSVAQFDIPLDRLPEPVLTALTSAVAPAVVSA